MAVSLWAIGALPGTNGRLLSVIDDGAFAMPYENDLGIGLMKVFTDAGSWFQDAMQNLHLSVPEYLGA